MNYQIKIRNKLKKNFCQKILFKHNNILKNKLVDIPGVFKLHSYMKYEKELNKSNRNGVYKMCMDIFCDDLSSWIEFEKKNNDIFYNDDCKHIYTKMYCTVESPYYSLAFSDLDKITVNDNKDINIYSNDNKWESKCKILYR